jgi:hypothetical protein
VRFLASLYLMPLFIKLAKRGAWVVILYLPKIIDVCNWHTIQTGIGQSQQATILRISTKVGYAVWNATALLPGTSISEESSTKEWIEGRRSAVFSFMTGICS